MNIKDLALKATSALEDFMRSESTLFELDAHEQTMTAKFAAYLKDSFSDWDVDCEYNRNLRKPKEINGRKVKPDIIVHHRAKTENLLVIEVKKNKAESKDIQKLIKLTQEPFNYMLGLMVIFNIGCEPNKHLRWFEAGNEIQIS